MAPHDNTGYGSDSSDDSLPSGIASNDTNRFLFKPTDADKEELRPGDIISFRCSVMNTISHATVLYVGDRKDENPLGLYPIYPLSREDSVCRIATRNDEGKLVHVDGNTWPIKHFKLVKGETNETVGAHLKREGEELVAILQKHARKAAKETGNPLLEIMISDKFQSKQNQKNDRAGMVITTTTATEKEGGFLSSDDEEEENVSTLQLVASKLANKKKIFVATKSSTGTAPNNKRSAAKSSTGAAPKKRVKSAPVANRQCAAAAGAPSKPPFVSPPQPYANALTMFHPSSMPSQLPPDLFPYNNQMQLSDASFGGSQSTSINNTACQQFSLPPPGTSNFAPWPRQDVLQQWPPGTNLMNPNMFALMNNTSHAPSGTGGCSTASSLPLTTGANAKNAHRVKKRGGAAPKASAKKVPSNGNGTAKERAGRKPGSVKHSKEELGRLVLAAHEVHANREVLNHKTLKKEFDKQEVEEGVERIERTGSALLSRYTKLQKAPEDGEDGDFVKVIKELQKDEAQQNNVVTTVQLETSSDNGETEEGEAVSGPKVASNLDSRNETLQRRLKKQKETKEAQKESDDLMALVSSASDFLQSYQGEPSSDTNHVEMTKMKHTVEDLGETVGGLEKTVGGLETNVGNMTNVLAQLLGSVQSLSDKIDNKM